MPTVFVYVCCTFRSSDFFTIRQERIRGGSTYAECNSGQRDPAIVSQPRLTRRDTIDSVQLAKHHTGGDRQTGREGGTEGARQDGGWEGGRVGGSKGRAGREGATGGREEAMM